MNNTKTKIHSDFQYFFDDDYIGLPDDEYVDDNINIKEDVMFYADDE